MPSCRSDWSRALWRRVGLFGSRQAAACWCSQRSYGHRDGSAHLMTTVRQVQTPSMPNRATLLTATPVLLKHAQLARYHHLPKAAWMWQHRRSRSCCTVRQERAPSVPAATEAKPMRSEPASAASPVELCHSPEVHRSVSRCCCFRRRWPRRWLRGLHSCGCDSRCRGIGACTRPPSSERH